jgi:hypothetical protein
MASKIVGYYKELPSWSKGVVAIGGIALVGIIAYTVYKKVKNISDLKINLKESDSASQELSDLATQGIRPTLSNSQVQSLINALKDAMNGCGTNEQRIYDTFSKLNNDADVKLLLKLWQVQYYEPCSATSPISYARWMFNDKAFGGNLSEWLNYDLSSSEIKQINSIFAKKGIKHKF